MTRDKLHATKRVLSKNVIDEDGEIDLGISICIQ